MQHDAKTFYTSTFYEFLFSKKYKGLSYFLSANPRKRSTICRQIIWVCLIILWGWRLKGYGNFLMASRFKPTSLFRTHWKRQGFLMLSDNIEREHGPEMSWSCRQSSWKWQWQGPIFLNIRCKVQVFFQILSTYAFCPRVLILFQIFIYLEILIVCTENIGSSTDTNVFHFCYLRFSLPKVLRIWF